MDDDFHVPSIAETNSLPSLLKKFSNHGLNLFHIFTILSKTQSFYLNSPVDIAQLSESRDMQEECIGSNQAMQSTPPSLWGLQQNSPGPIFVDPPLDPKIKNILYFNIINYDMENGGRGAVA